MHLVYKVDGLRCDGSIEGSLGSLLGFEFGICSARNAVDEGGNIIPRVGKEYAKLNPVTYNKYGTYQPLITPTRLPFVMQYHFSEALGVEVRYTLGENEMADGPMEGPAGSLGEMEVTLPVFSLLGLRLVLTGVERTAREDGRMC